MYQVENCFPKGRGDPGPWGTCTGIADDSWAIRNLYLFEDDLGVRREGGGGDSSCSLARTDKSRPQMVRAPQFLERASATGLDLPEMCFTVQSYSVIAERWRCCRFETGSDFLVMASTRGMWSVKTSKWEPSRRCRKWRMAAWTARSSLSKVP